MNKFCKALAVLLLFSLLTALPSCSDKQIILPDGQYLLKNSQSVGIVIPTVPLDPAAIYSSIVYTPDMFLGTYMLPGGKEELDKYTADMEYFDFSGDLYTKLTVLPYGIHSVRQEDSDDFHWMSLSFKSDTGNSVNKDCAFTIEGNKLSLRILLNKFFDAETNQIVYEFCETPLEYTFSFSGAYLTLTCGEKSVTLKSAMFGKDSPDFYLSADIAPDSKIPAGIRHIEFNRTGSGKTRLLLGNELNETIENASALISEDGLFTLTVPDEGKNNTYQFVFFYAAEDAFILTAGSSIYFFTEPYSITPDETTGEDTSAEDTTEPVDPVDPVDPDDQKASAEALAEALIKAFEKAGINVTIDKETGELNMDSALLFGGNSCDIYDNGMSFLNQVITVYSSVVFSDEYSDLISKIYIEGHCAPVEGLTYDDCLPLSLKRAETVLNYCISDHTGMDPKYTEALKGTLEAVGLSNTRPVYNEQGAIDMDASRRVTFRFVISPNR